MKAIVGFLVFLVSTTSAFAGDLSGFVALKSAYVLSNNVVANDEPVIQGDLFYTHESGLYAELWVSVGVTQSTGNEVDYIFGLNKNGYKVEFAYYHFPTANFGLYGPSVHYSPAQGWDVAAQYFRTSDAARDEGAAVWVEYTKGQWGAKLSHTDFAGRVTALKGWYGWTVARDTTLTVTAHVPIFDPDNTGKEVEGVLSLQHNF